MKKQKTEVVVYFPYGDKEKEKLVKNYCKNNDYKIVQIFRGSNDIDLDDIMWDEAIFKMYNTIIDLSKKHKIEKVILYELNDLNYGLHSQIAICEYMLQVDVIVETIKQGEYVLDFNFDSSLEIIS